MYFFRLKPIEAMEHLGIVSRESFALWCEKVNLELHQYEFSTRKYLNSGEFFAIADAIEINKLKAMHGDNWVNYYKHANDVVGFLPEHEQTRVDDPQSDYTPTFKDVLEFKKKLFNEKP